MTKPKNKLAFVFGDVQGQWELLTELLFQEGLIDKDGTRLRTDVDIISMGDLAHFGNYPMGNKVISAADDYMCFQFLFDGIIDVVLWGNHERPLSGTVGMYEIFSGFKYPSDKQFMGKFDEEVENGRIRAATYFKQFLITHAGLNDNWDLKGTPKSISTLLNKVDALDLTEEDIPKEYLRIMDFLNPIGYVRGGNADKGGIFWRHNDENIEPLYKGVRQIFGHTPCVTPEAIPTPKGDSYCLDISKDGGIAGMWLPDEKIVCVRD